MNKETKALHQAIQLTSSLHIISESINRLAVRLHASGYENDLANLRSAIDGVADALPDTIVSLIKPTAKRKNRSV